MFWSWEDAWVRSLLWGYPLWIAHAPDGRKGLVYNLIIIFHCQMKCPQASQRLLFDHPDIFNVAI
ncbi:hypothetical protein DBR37_13855 [Herminiimonas sp. KBW02]|nr:hypothetical protein DBR37_13855 [Herminiimonas sp. KBW02]